MSRENAVEAITAREPQRLRGSGKGPTLFTRGRGPFVGREAAVAELVALIDRVRNGSGALALVAGEPGIGKTALVERFATLALANDARILWGSCWDAERQPPYWPLVQMLRRLIAEDGAAGVARALGEDGRWLGPLLPECGEVTSPALSSGEQARFRLFDTFTRLLTDAARERPVLMVVDDLHWADEGTFRYLEFIGHQLRDMRVLAVCTYRDILAEQSAPIKSHLPSLMRMGQRIDLQGMTVAEIGALMHAVTGQAPDADFVIDVHRSSGGNPLFAGEVARAGLAGRRLAGADAVPSAVSQVVTSRLTRLPTATVTLLRQAAVLGNAFDLSTLARMAGCSIQRARETLYEALHGRIVAEASDDGHMEFIHALVRDALYKQLSSTDATRLHRRVADILVACGLGADGAAAARLAHHFSLGGSVDQGIAYATMAGEHALRALAYEDAAAHFQKALNLEWGAGRHRPEILCRLLLRLGQAQWRSGDGQLASTTYARALELARSTRDGEAFALAALGCCARSQLWVFDRELVQQLDQALMVLEEAETAIRARVLARLARMLYLEPTALSRRAELAARAIELARSANDPVTLIEALSARPLDTTADRLATASEVFHLASRIGDEEQVMEAQFSRAMAMLESGDRNGAELVIGSYGVLADKRRVPLWQFHHRCLVACLARMSGRFDEAEARLNEAADLGRRAKLPGVDVICEHHLAHLALDRGHPAIAAASVQSLTAHLARSPLVPDYIHCILTRLQVALGAETEARACLDRILIPERLPRVAGPVGAVSLVLLAEVVSSLGARHHAAALFEELQPYEACVAVSARFVYCAAPVSQALGLLAALLDRPDDAERYFDIALEMAARMGASTWLTKIRDQSARLRHVPRSAGGVNRPGREGRSQPTAVPADAIPRLEREGEFWTLAYHGREVRLKDSKGINYLAALLREPGRDFHVGDLIGLASEAIASEAGVQEARLHVDRPRDAGEWLDARAKAAYKERLAKLADDLEDAELRNDHDGIARILCEREALAGELSRAVGLGNRSRKASDASERARVNVQRCIRNVMDRASEQDGAIGRLLKLHVKTGVFCSWEP